LSINLLPLCGLALEYDLLYRNKTTNSKISQMPNARTACRALAGCRLKQWLGTDYQFAQLFY